MRTAPDGFGTTTIAAHHGVGSLTRDFTPKRPPFVLTLTELLA